MTTPQRPTAPAGVLPPAGPVAPGGDGAGLRRARLAPGLLRPFNAAGVLDLADVHVARCLTELAGEDDPAVALAAALAVRAPRLGHVCVDLATASSTVVGDDDGATPEPGAEALPWPAPEPWLTRLATSPLVEAGGHTADPAGRPPGGDPGRAATAPPDDDARPLRLAGTLLYLDRYWRQEQFVAGDLLDRADRLVGDVDVTVLGDGLDRLFRPRPGEPANRVPPQPAGSRPPDLQRLAAVVAVLRRFAVIAGGPGTGKTTTVSRVVALLAEQAHARDWPPPRVALAAPTGRAAARLAQAVQDDAGGLDTDPRTRRFLGSLEATTLHRLLGWRPGSRSRFRHDSTNRLPHDVVVVDETSMVSLSLMARLLDAVRADARLILVGDPEQLVSVEAGAVLGDVVGPAAGMRMRPRWKAALSNAAGEAVPAGDAPDDTPIGDAVVVLRQVYRFGSAIAALAAAVQRGDGDATVEALRRGTDGEAASGRPRARAAVGATAPAARWLEAPGGEHGLDPALLDPVRRLVVDHGRRLHDAAVAGDAAGAAALLGRLRVLCAHRHGPAGVDGWTERIERWLAEAIDGFGRATWYPGQPLLVTENDYELGLYNGDTGIVVIGDRRLPVAVFERDGRVVERSPTRLRSVETMYAMTVHKGQGSQYQRVVLALPEPTSPALTRQLVYTAVTRAQQELIVIGSETSVRAAVARPVARASGLGRLLWGGSGR